MENEDISVSIKTEEIISSNIERPTDSTRDHSNKNNLEAAVCRCSSEQVLLKISQFSHKNNCDGVSF